MFLKPLEASTGIPHIYHVYDLLAAANSLSKSADQ